MPTMKSLLIKPADVSLRPLGPGSLVADAQVSVYYDRDVALADGTFITACVPLVETSVPADGLVVPVLVNDDPQITAGAGFRVIVELLFWPRSGLHGQGQNPRFVFAVSSDSDDRVALGKVAPPTTLPYYVPGSNLSGIALWTDPTTGERIPYLAEPADGTLTTIGH